MGDRDVKEERWSESRSNEGGECYTEKKQRDQSYRERKRRDCPPHKDRIGNLNCSSHQNRNMNKKFTHFYNTHFFLVKHKMMMKN